MSALVSNSDLAFGFFGLLLISRCMYRVGQYIMHWCSPRTCTVAALVAFALTMVFAVRYHGQLQMARLIPFSNVMVLGNWLPVGAAVLSGLVVGQSTIPAWRRLAVVALLGGLGWYTVCADLFATSPQPASPRYIDGFCMQTTPDSCSACCAANLLVEHGIPASESEMIRLCFTRHGGTPELGLYRGLKLKTAGTPWDVEVLNSDTDTFLKQSEYPALLLVNSSLNDSGSVFQRTFRADHAVVVFGTTKQDKVLIADPSAGLHTWSIDRFRENWFGVGLRLVASQ